MKADHLLFNGRIHSMDPAQPEASCMLIHAGRIVALGGDELLSSVGDAAEKIDLQGRVVIPGMVDSHAHLALYTRSMHDVDLMDTRTVEEALERIRTYAHKYPQTAWIQGWGWCQDDWPDRRFPTAEMIDRVVPDIPVTVTARSGHSTWSNSLAFRRAHLGKDTPDPAGGEIQRDALGNPTGILLDEAHKLVHDVIPPMPIPELADKMELTIRSMNAMGVTGFHDFDGADSFRALQVLHAEGRLSLRVTKNILVRYLDEALDMGLRGGFGDDFLRIGSIKIFADGALGSRTGATFEPYEGEPGNRGLIVTDQEDLVQMAHKATLGGFSCAIHAIGDRAVHNVLDAYESVRKIEAENGISRLSRRHSLEHVQLIHPQDAPRLGQLGITASMQPIHATSDMYMADNHWGDRAAYSYNWRLQLDHGARLVFGSDAPVESVNPFLGLHAACTRRRLDGSPGPQGWRSENNGRLTLQEALQAYTVGPAWAAGLEDRLGRLVPGCLADLLVLNQDLFSVDPMEIATTRPVAVMLDGKWIVNEM